jgi:hypothetical protein
VKVDDIPKYCELFYKLLDLKGNALIRVTAQLIGVWHSALVDAGFIVESRPLAMHKCKADVAYCRWKQRRPDTFYYVVAHRTVNWYWNYEPSPYLPENTAGDVRAGYITNVPTTHSSARLRGAKGEILRTAENSVRVLCEMIRQYCPHPGTVADFCAGTMTTMMACIVTGRNGVFGDRDTVTGNAGVNRAKLYYQFLHTTGTQLVFVNCTLC